MSETENRNDHHENGKMKNGGHDRRQSDISDISEDISNLIPTPPDGGWGWVIVASSLFCNIIVDGIGYSFGIFLPEFVNFFDETRSKVSLIGSLLCGTYLCAGKCTCFFLTLNLKKNLNLNISVCQVRKIIRLSYTVVIPLD